MSRGPAVPYKCLNDCSQAGCPGHTVTFACHHTSMVYRVEISDEERPVFFDPDQFRAILKSYEEWKKL